MNEAAIGKKIIFRLKPFAASPLFVLTKTKAPVRFEEEVGLGLGLSTGNRFAVFLFFGCGVLEKCQGLFRNWCPDMIFGISRLVSDFCLEINHLYHKHVPLLCCQEIGKDFSMSLITFSQRIFQRSVVCSFRFR